MSLINGQLPRIKAFFVFVLLKAIS
jgi:hypothetical protein